jgi:LmbE family N-acetylglucosaminyl deacetylase
MAVNLRTWAFESLKKDENKTASRERKRMEHAGLFALAVLLVAPLAALHAAEPAKKKRTILAIGAHLDDPEIGAGGVIAKAVKNGHRVVVVDVCGDFSTFRVTRGREREVREKLLAHAQKMGIEKRFLDYGYQQIADDLPLMQRLAEIVVELNPDIAFIHSRFERDRSPSDHSTLGAISERSVRNAETILGVSKPEYTSYGKEIYAYEVYPQPSFVPDVFVDIRDVLKETLESVNFFGTDIYAPSPAWPKAGRTDVTMQVHPEDWELPLTHYAEMKYALAVFRGYQSGTRFAEGFKALDPAVLGRRVLQEVVS